jgi:predicted CXXCH cytochrome family protein
MMSCTACHTHIPQSRVSADINVPGIELCRDCHQQGGRAVSAAPGGCFECHSYHDWRNEKRTQGKFNLTTLRGMNPDAEAPTAYIK